MIATGEGISHARPHRRAAAATDIVQLQIHGHQVTHIDALSHWFWDATMYNDVSAKNVTSDRGAIEHGVEEARGGIVTRGVLLDISAARGVEWLEPGQAVTPGDLSTALDRQSVDVAGGDALLLYTGYSRYRSADPNDADPPGWPGWSAACLPWFHETGHRAHRLRDKQ